MTADLAYGFAITGADDVARSMQSVASQLERLTSRQQQNTQASQQMARAGQSAAQGFGQMVQQGQQLTQRVQGIASAVQSLVGQLGGQDRTAGLIASVAANVSQFASMGAMLGPGGAVVGGIAGLTAALVGVIQRENDVAAATAEANEQLRDQARAAIEARQRLTELRNMEAAAEGGDLAGTFLTGTSEADLELQAEEARARVASARAEVERRRRAEAEYERVAGRRSVAGVAEDLAAETRAAEAEVERLLSTATAIEAEIRRRYDEAGAASRAATEREIAEIDSRITAREEREEREAERRAVRAGANAERAARAEAEAWDRAIAEIRATAEDNLMLLEEGRMTDAGQMSGQGSALDSSIVRRYTEAQSERERDTSSTDFFGEQARALADFERSATGSLDAVIGAYERLAETSAGSAREVARSGQLMSRGIQGVASDIGGAIGGDMLGAFDEAVGAWLDGSASLVEAAEEMAKGVLKALVQEGIVQAVAETARAIADLAGYRYDSAALHFAAAAAWGAVAGVAGGIGAATGAFGGAGAGAQEAAGSRELADRNQGDQQQGGTTVINLYPGGYITRDEVAAGMVDALNYAGRNGRTLDSRLLRGA